MEGPSPVSALIHAATMVTAGVYLVARCTPLFVLAPEAQLVVACIGGFTALLAALIALTQNDLKRVLAYSTISQLGYMFLALGCGRARRRHSLATFAVVAAIFHLFTHAFFKALLFLGAGSVMHAMGDVIDMRRFSGLRKVLPITHWTFLCGAAGPGRLSARCPASGARTKSSPPPSTPDTCGNGVPVAVSLPACYRGADGVLHVPRLLPDLLGRTGRAGRGRNARPRRDDDAAHGHQVLHAPAPVAQRHGGQAHESPPVMTIPLIVLAVIRRSASARRSARRTCSPHFLERTPGFPPAPKHECQLDADGSSSSADRAGRHRAGVADVRRAARTGRQAGEHVAAALTSCRCNKFHVDELYGAFIVGAAGGANRSPCASSIRTSSTAWSICSARCRALIGELFRPVQNGLVQFYALAMVLGLTVFLGGADRRAL